MISILLAVLLTPTPSPRQDLAERFSRALSADDLRAFFPLVEKPAIVASPAWRSVRDLVDRYECISISSWRSSVDPSTGMLILDLAGSGIAKNEGRERRAIPNLWYLRTKGPSIASVDDEPKYVASALARAETEAQRRGIAEAHEPALRETARVIEDEMLRRPDPSFREAAAFLVEWSRARGDPETESYALLALASLGGGAPFFDAALSAARHTSSCDAVAYAEIAAGWNEKDPERRAALLQAAAEAAPSLEDPRIAIRALRAQFGIAYSAVDLARAHEVVGKIETLSKRFDISQGLLTVLHCKATLAAAINDYERAIAVTTQLVRLARECVSPSMEATAWELLGQFHQYSDPADDARSVEAYQHALELNPPVNDELAVFIHSNLGNALIRLGRVSEAATHLEPALAAGRASDANLTNALAFAASLRHAQGRYDEAMTFAHEGIEHEKDTLWTVWALKSELAQMLIECGDPQAAIEQLRESIDLIEARRALTTSDPLVRAHHLGSRASVYHLLLSTLVDEGQAEEACEVAERLKARAMSDSVAGPTSRLPLTGAEQARERTFNERILELNRAVIGATGTAAVRTRQQLRAARADLAGFMTEMALRYSPALAPPSEGPTLAADRSSVIIEYAVLPDSIVAFVLHHGRVTARRLPRNRMRIERETSRLLARIENRDVRYATDARIVYRALIAPIADLLPKREQILTIVPDAFLWNIPFDVLRSPAGKPLIDTYAVMYAPSVTMLDWAAHRRAPHLSQRKTLLAFGDPVIAGSTARKAATYRDLSLGALPDAEREVRALTDLYGALRSTVLTGSKARESVLKKIVGGYRILHLATHGIIDHESPLYSAVVLARSQNDIDDGLLEAREMLDLDLRADLVILSGCDTARGDLFPGEGVIGMSWALLSAGCPTTVVSRWKADSRSTSLLMVELHKRLMAGDSAAQALRRAKLALRQDEWYEHAFYWAPFMVVGDGTLLIVAKR